MPKLRRPCASTLSSKCCVASSIYDTWIVCTFTKRWHLCESATLLVEYILDATQRLDEKVLAQGWRKAGAIFALFGSFKIHPV